MTKFLTNYEPFAFYAKIRSTVSLFASPSVGIFFGTSTGSTEDVAHLIAAAFGEASSEPIEM